MRAHMADFGLVAPVGRMGLERLLAIVADQEDQRIPGEARVCLAMLAAQLAVVKRSWRTTVASGRAPARQKSGGD
jgi:transposase